MAFNCRIKFTGLCAFVPNKPLPGTERMCVVLVDGTGADATAIRALDGTVLRRHRAFLSFDLKNLPGFTSQRPKEGKGIWYLEKQRLTLDVGAGGQAFSTTFDPAIDAAVDHAGPTTPQEARSFSWVADMKKVAPAHSKMDANAVSKTPPAEVLAQVILTKGTLFTSKIEKVRWCFPNVLGPDIIRKPVAHEVTLELTSIPKLIINAAKLSPSAVPVSLELQPATTGEDVEIEIVNLCEENPLRWDRHNPQPKDDEDFRWYYQLLEPSERAKVKNTIRGLSLPIAFKEKSSLLPAATGVNCFTVRFADLLFDPS